jgi:hypothetical protein
MFPGRPVTASGSCVTCTSASGLVTVPAPWPSFPRTPQRASQL